MLLILSHWRARDLLIKTKPLLRRGPVGPWAWSACMSLLSRLVSRESAPACRCPFATLSCQTPLKDKSSNGLTTPVVTLPYPCLPCFRTFPLAFENFKLFFQLGLRWQSDRTWIRWPQMRWFHLCFPSIVLVSHRRCSNQFPCRSPTNLEPYPSHPLGICRSPGLAKQGYKYQGK